MLHGLCGWGRWSVPLGVGLLDLLGCAEKTACGEDVLSAAGTDGGEDTVASILSSLASWSGTLGILWKRMRFTRQ